MFVIRHKKKFLIIFLILILVGSAFAAQYNKQLALPGECKWETSSPHEYRDQYINYNGAIFKWYDGTIYNRDYRTMNIKGAIIRVFDEKNILIGEGYTPMNRTLHSNEGIEYNVNVIFGSRYKETLDSGKIHFDAYPDIAWCR